MSCAAYVGKCEGDSASDSAAAGFFDHSGECSCDVRRAGVVGVGEDFHESVEADCAKTVVCRVGTDLHESGRSVDGGGAEAGEGDDGRLGVDRGVELSDQGLEVIKGHLGA